MNILHVCQNYHPSVGGPQYTMKHVSEKLVSYYNDQLQVCTTNSMFSPEASLFEKIDPSVEWIESVQVNRLPFNRWHYRLIELAGKVYGKVTGNPLPHAITKYRWQLDSPAINKMMAESGADVIMATTITYNFCDYPLWRYKTNNPKPFILYGAIHLHKAPGKIAIKRAEACDCYIANTNFERDELIKYGVDENKIVTIGTGIELDDFIVPQGEVDAFRQKYNIGKNDVLIGFIGRLVKGKGVAILMEVFKKLYADNKNIKLLLAGGTTDYVSEIKRVISEEKLPIILIENFETKMKALLFNALDIFVLASQSESFGVVFLEAWACRKPVIGAKMGATESLLNDGVDSILFEAGNSQSLQVALQDLINDDTKRQMFGENGFKKVTENFTWHTIVAKYRNAYETGIKNFRKKVNQ